MINEVKWKETDRPTRTCLEENTEGPYHVSVLPAGILTGYPSNDRQKLMDV
jgi:hypothetical protein